ncbi:MAG: FAD binding domain-containing protein [Bacillota bacterium]|nr:FAD binding domain-containing protein [Bacillota bacterium]
MLTIGEYLKPKSVKEAYELLNSKKKTALIGGGAWIRMSPSRRISLAIDLSQAGLRYINDTDETIEIGAMTTFGDIDKSPILQQYFSGIIPRSFQDIVGVQLRNIVTIGGTVYSKYGFSDVITALLVLNCKVVLHAKGELLLKDFLILPVSGKERDVLEKLVIDKEELKAAFQMMRNSRGDYAILNVAAAKKDKEFKIAVGARPQRAMLAEKAMEFISNNPISEETAAKAGEIASEELHLGNNSLGTSKYRKALCQVLVKRAILEVAHEN